MKLLAAAALASAAGTAVAAAKKAAPCNTRASCMDYVHKHSAWPAVHKLAEKVLDARSHETWAHVAAAEEVSSTDSKWCPDQGYWEFLPAQVGKSTIAAPTLSWNGDGCFAGMMANTTFTSTGATVTLTGASSTSLLCSDTYMITTAYSVQLAEVAALSPSHTVSFNFTSASEALDVKLNGIRVFVLPCGLLGTVTSALKTVSLFEGNSTTLLAANYDFLTSKNIWKNPTPPFGQVTAVDKKNIRSGTYLAIAKLDGLDPMIALGTMGRTGHSALAVWEGDTLYVCESTDANPFGKAEVYWPPPYGIIRHDWDTWVGLATKAGYHVGLLPLQSQYADAFDEDAFWAWFGTVQGMPYGYHSMLYSFVDTGLPFMNLPQPATADVVTNLFGLLEDVLPPASGGVNVYAMVTQGINKRLGTDCTTYNCVLDALTANAAAGKTPTLVTEAMTIPQDDTWTYGGNYSMVCSEFAHMGWKVALEKAFPVFSQISAGEQTPKDNYQLGMFDGSYFTEANCPGGVTAADQGAVGNYCQLMGPYKLYLNGFNSIPLYAGMNNYCPSQWPSFFRCPANNPTCC